MRSNSFLLAAIAFASDEIGREAWHKQGEDDPRLRVARLQCARIVQKDKGKEEHAHKEGGADGDEEKRPRQSEAANDARDGCADVERVQNHAERESARKGDDHVRTRPHYLEGEEQHRQTEPA